MENQIIHEFKEYIHMTSEIGALYHDAAVKANLSDSVMNILYTVMTFGSECTYQHHPGRPVRWCIPLGHGGRGCRHGYQPVRWWYPSPCLFRAAQS